MRTRLVICFWAITLSSFTACSPSPDCFRENVFCVGLVTDTRSLNDFGINHDTWAGLEQSHADGVIDQIAYIESVNPKDFKKNIAFFVDAGYDVIVTSGIGLRDATLRSADLYPDSVFIGMNQPDDENRPNFIPVTFPEDQMGFLAGALAAQLTSSKTVGAACETSGIASMWRYCEGFRAGAIYMDASVKVFVIYRDNGSSSNLFIDDVWGYETAQELIDNNVDVIFAAGGGTAVGALRAAGEVKIQAIGAERDQAAALGVEGSSVVTSVLGETSSTVRELMRSLRDGNVTEEKIGSVGYVPFDKLVSKEVVQEIDHLLAGLEKGEIKTNIPAEKP
ncbi:MAG TPA: BMP family ABC transporter substrate-binding protein [Anaerolineales bacterium]|nr:BMP family ABC transporter substrate-binding protein [Anaerolineales bacterium]